MVSRKTATRLRASLTASSLDGWMMARMSFMAPPETTEYTEHTEKRQNRRKQGPLASAHRRGADLLCSVSFPCVPCIPWSLLFLPFAARHLNRPLGQVVRVHRVVGKLDRVERLEPLLDVRHQPLVVRRRDVQGMAGEVHADLPLLHHHLAALEDVARQLEHGPLIGAGGVDGHVAVRADTEV